MNIYYRGYVIHEDIPAICYTVYGRRPSRGEVASCTTARQAMRLVDGEVARDGRERTAPPLAISAW